MLEKISLRGRFWRVLGLIAVAIMFAAGRAAQAQTDEIQVYDAQIAAPGVVNLTLHDNYTPDGRAFPDFPGGVTPRHTLNGVPEWALGVTPWWELGLYLPLYTFTGGDRFELDGFKLRTLFVDPHAGDKPFFYGVNFEFSFNTLHWDTSRYTSEIRPIVGWRVGRFGLILNPILDNSWKGVSRLDFAPASRLEYRLASRWQVAVEAYDDFGPLKAFLPATQQSHQVFGVVDFNGKPISVELGAGVGLTHGTDGLVLKLILSKDIGVLRGVRRDR